MIWTPTAEDIIMMHRVMAAHIKCVEEIRDKSLIESAVAAINAGFGGIEVYSTVLMKAAGLGCKLVQNHAFVDGNKRIGACAMLLICRMNGVTLKYTQKELVDLIMGIACGETTFEDALLWLKAKQTGIQATNTPAENLAKVKKKAVKRRIQRFHLKPGVTHDEIRAFIKSKYNRIAENPSWISKDSKYGMDHTFVMVEKGKNKRKDRFEISIDIGFPEDLSKWDDDAHVIIIDEDFLQPYTPFHELKTDEENGKRTETVFRTLEWTVNTYNEFMRSLPFLEPNE